MRDLALELLNLLALRHSSIGGNNFDSSEQKIMTFIPDWFTWSNATSFFNSSFTTSLIGALAGAYAGARAAQKITERAKDREQLVSQIRTTNAATMVAFSAFNAGAALKKQHVQPMYEEFESANAKLEAYKADRATGQRQGNADYFFTADLRTFSAPLAPIDTLKDLVFNKISAHGRPLALVSMLEQSFLGLREVIQKRDALVHRFASGQIPKDLTHKYYFGQQLPNGDTNREFPDLIFAIHSYVSDITFFGSLLCDDLVTHGNSVHAAYTKRFRKGAPDVSTLDFSGLREKGIIPPASDYTAWLNAFGETRS
jgi:hypothetical protein